MTTALSIDAPSVATDALLAIEVADSSLRIDREFKAPLYARHAVAEYWLVDLLDREVEIFRAPSDGGYAIRQTARGDETIAPLALPAARVRAGAIWE